MRSLYPQEANDCDGFLRHKMFHISPILLQKHDIPYDVIMQNAGEFIITFPKVVLLEMSFFIYNSSFRVIISVLIRDIIAPNR